MGCCSDCCHCGRSGKTQDSQTENGPDNEVSLQRPLRCRCMRKVLAITFSQLGLFILIVLYLIGGAYLFNYLERGPHQRRLNESLRVLQNSFNDLTDTMSRVKRGLDGGMTAKVRFIGNQCVNFQLEAIQEEIERLQLRINHEHLMSRKAEISKLRQEINELIAIGETELLNAILNQSFKINLPAQIQIYEKILKPGRSVGSNEELIYHQKLHAFVEKIYEAIKAGWVIPSLEEGGDEDVSKTIPDISEISLNPRSRNTYVESKELALNKRKPRTDPWTKAGALFYVITVITTIGYGEVVPVTKYGRLATIFYGLFGIPMMLLFLANLGSLMADTFRILYKQLCCCCKKKPKPVPAALTGSTSNWRSPNLSSRERLCTASPSLPIRSPAGRRQRPSALQELIHRTAAPLPGITESVFISLAGSNSIFARAHQARKESRNVQVPLWVIFIIFALYLILGGIFFAYWEHWTFLNSMYFVFVTVSTIGFGDLLPGLNDDHPTHRLYKYIFSNVYLLLGLAMVAMCFDLMQQELKRRSKKLARKIGLISRQSYSKKDSK